MTSVEVGRIRVKGVDGLPLLLLLEYLKHTPNSSNLVKSCYRPGSNPWYTRARDSFKTEHGQQDRIVKCLRGRMWELSRGQTSYVK